VTTPPWEPQPELSTERVRGGAWKGLVVLVVAVLVVGALVWKPWDSGVGPDASPTSGAIALSSAVPLIGPLFSSPEPSTAPSNRPSFAPADFGSVLLSDDGAFVQCSYDRQTPPQLRSVTVIGPTITPAADAADKGLSYVAWSATLESQRLSKIFEDD